MIDESDIRAAVGGFGFSPDEVTSIVALPKRVKNVNFLVTARGEDWVVKAHRVEGTTDGLSLSHTLEMRLAEHGFPVAEPRTTSAGAVTVRRGSVLFTMHRWVEGRHVTIVMRDAVHAARPALAAEFGAALGTMHALAAPLLDGVAAPDIASLLAGPSRTRASIRHGAPHRLRKVARARRRAPSSPYDAWLLDRLPMLLAEARVLTSPTWLPLLDPADVVLAHNDLNWENLVLSDDHALRAVLDFDNVTPLPRALEVGAAAAVLVGPEASRLEQFLTAYEAEAGARLDRAAVRLGMRWKCTRSVLWTIDAHLSGRRGEPTLVRNWSEGLAQCLEAVRGQSHDAGDPTGEVRGSRGRAPGGTNPRGSSR